ncbi:MAG: hypothetical protein JST00_06880 [Deltaproteobacteria bacterium]|nr:hypothetical protein [Deltaproteobacteria bacterium]
MRLDRTMMVPALTAAMMACGGAAGVETKGGAAGTDAPSEPAPPPRTLADDVVVDHVSINQAVEVTLVKEGAAVATPNAPIIAGRPALVRVFAKPTGKATPSLAAELRVARPGKADVVVRAAARPIALEMDAMDPATTFTFELAADAITADASFSVTLGTTLEPGSDVVRFPAEGSASLGAKTGSAKMRVKFVPVRYDQDGSGRTPSLSDVSAYRNALYKMYPAADVEISVREPLPWTKVVEGDGNGWDDLLDAVIQTRRTDRAPDDVYYVGIFTPAASLHDFCDSACVLGVAPLAMEREIGLRVAMVLGYDEISSGSTLAQELAHAMGREHAPCGGADGPDPEYPYARAAIGVVGWNPLTKKLVDPSRAKDFMSYCGPTWISDYTYAGLYERLEYVSGGTSTSPQKSTGSKSAMQTYRVRADGSVRPGPIVDVAGGGITSGGKEGIEIVYESANGATTTVRGRAVADRTGSTLVLAPAAPAGATHARIAVGAVTFRTTVAR